VFKAVLFYKNYFIPPLLLLEAPSLFIGKLTGEDTIKAALSSEAG
jgi:hypothetical protein